MRNRWHQTGGTDQAGARRRCWGAVSHWCAYLFAVHVLHAAFIGRGAAALPEAGAANLRR